MLSSVYIEYLKNLIAKRESAGSGDYQALYPPGSNINNASAIGKYQFTPGTIRLIANKLQIKPPSVSEFYLNAGMQETFMNELLQSNYEDIIRNDLDSSIGKMVTSKNTGKRSVINLNGLLAGAHLGGLERLKNFILYGIDKDDGHTYISDYVESFSEFPVSDNFSLAGLEIIPVLIIIGIFVSLILRR